MRATAAALVALAAVGSAPRAQSAGDAERGRLAFQRCYSCHSIDRDETARLQGPNLYGVVGRRAAAVTGFDYSAALRERGEAGLLWEQANLDAFIADPEGFLPGTAMSAPPLRDAQERADVVAFLKELPIGR